MESYQIVQASPTDFNAIKKLMLNALQSDPTAFSTDYSDYAHNSENWWQNYLYPYLAKFNATLFLAKQEGELKGMVGLLFDTKNRRKHVASIVWFYVDTNSRHLGLGRELLKTAISEAKKVNNIRKINLLVNAPQGKAISIYKDLGFEIVGTLKEELLINNQYVDEYVMELFV